MLRLLPVACMIRRPFEEDGQIIEANLRERVIGEFADLKLRAEIDYLRWSTGIRVVARCRCLLFGLRNVEQVALLEPR